ncbi:MAG TPA: Calx-beta domain-containing protein, partial [Thermoanaerobaculia bacterium]|nr:Calx-beta domain-containing protein [Thermoanaerobaculia bacterium]
RLTFAGTQPNTYSGGTRVLDGELRLAKSDGVDAIAGDLLVGGTGFGSDQSGHLTTIANEQIPDSATIQVGTDSTIGVGGIETVGPLEIESGAQIRGGLEFNSSLQTIGTLILAGDITISPVFNGYTTTFEGDIALAGTRTVTSCETCSATTLMGFRDHTPGSGLILRDGVFSVLSGSYHGPTVIESGTVVVENPNTAVRLRAGTFWGNVGSLFAEGGTVNASAFSPGVTTTGDFRLSPPARLRLGLDADEVKIQVGGTLDFGHATLIFDHSPHTMVLGDEYRIVRNDGTGPIRGTFAGVLEGTFLQGRLRVSYAGGDGNDFTLTEAGRYPTQIDLRIDPFHEADGDTVTMRVWVTTDRRPNFIAEGTVTFRDNDTVIGTATLDSAGKAVVTFPATWGWRTYSVTYEGNAELAPSTISQFVTVTPPVPVLTSVEPTTVQGGTTATLTLRGSGFLPNGIPLAEHYGLYEFTWISSTEVRATWDVPRSETDRTVEVWYGQPEPGGVQSNRLPLLVKAAPVPKTPLVFEQKAVVGPVIPGGGAAWMSIAFRRVNFRTTLERQSAVLPDTDRDGLVRWEQTETLAPHSIWLMADMTDGRILAGKTDGLIPDASPFPEAAILRDAQGRYSHLIFPYQYHEKWDVLWVRPGAGAWTLTVEDGGYGLDLDRSWNGHGVFNVSQMTPVSGSPPPPAGIEPGDVLLGIDWNAQRWFGDRVDAHLGESNGPGTLVQANWNAYAYEGTSLPVTVLRLGGTDGQVSVNYRTVDDTALAGVHYEGRAGTVTFGPGEILKTVEIPIIDDQRFLGDNTRFSIVLTDPA